MQLQLGFATGTMEDFDVLPTDFADASAERFRGGFFGGEKANQRFILIARLALFALGENALDETLSDFGVER